MNIRLDCMSLIIHANYIFYDPRGLILKPEVERSLVFDGKVWVEEVIKVIK